ncbi:hypothetical protein K491DRAFT_691335 [Lophiostoma macrostomum CBS 122681]|uniref:Uncharacterized protein n=1 Tax=Lophiostoma macrostomum CBS 122681 TaxID=1314788 RepID=A0A6A6TAY3_9PLEO|nr:hypothetical protein K491DRAFT_691335 [Lophiostoma macrostomum CBS 122681]
MTLTSKVPALLCSASASIQNMSRDDPPSPPPQPPPSPASWARPISDLGTTLLMDESFSLLD